MRSVFPLLLSASLVVASDEWGGNNVVMVEDGEWEDFRGKNPKFLAAFYAPW
jgi:hypothetical protein